MEYSRQIYSGGGNSCVQSSHVLRDVEKSIQKLFNGAQGTEGFSSGRPPKCTICSKLKSKLPVRNSDEVLTINTLNLLLQSLLVPGVKVELPHKLSLCEDCEADILNLEGIFIRLEHLREEFQDVRLKLGGLLITKSLQKCEVELQSWISEVKSVEHIFPSFLLLRNTRHRSESFGTGFFAEELTCSENYGDANYQLNQLDIKLETGVAAHSDDTEDDESVEANTNDSCFGAEDINSEHEDYNEGISADEIGENSTEVDNTFDLELRNSPEQNQCEIIVDNNVIFISSDIKLTTMTPQVILKRLNQHLEGNGELGRNRRRKYTSGSPGRIQYIKPELEKQLHFRSRLQRPRKRLKGARAKLRHQTSNQNNCKLCKTKFKDSSNLSRHLKFVHKIGEKNSGNATTEDGNHANALLVGPKLAFQCRLCSNCYMLKSSLRYHLKRGHGVLGLCCLSCSLSFDSVKELNIHQKETHGYHRPKGWEDNKKCKICGLDFNYNSKLRESHMVKVHGVYLNGKTLNCSHCDMTFNYQSVLTKHKLKAHNVGSKLEGFQCKFCLRYLIEKSVLKNHQKTIHNISSEANEDPASGNVYKCSLCPDAVEYRNYDGLLEHEVSGEHREEVNSRISVYCNLCRKNFDGDEDRLGKHLKGDEHQKELEALGEFDKTKFCVPCRQNFVSFDELKEHEETGIGHKKICAEYRYNGKTQEMPSESPLICHACPKLFTFRSQLDLHLLKSHSELERKCNICGQSFSNSADLILHKQGHRFEVGKNFVCDKCGKKFGSQYNLSQHIRVLHGGEIKCDECGELFKSKAKLRLHAKKQHFSADSGRSLKRLECPFCEKTFSETQGRMLRRHLCQAHANEHLKDKTHVCSVCFHVFGGKGELGQHLRQSHAHLKCPFCEKFSQNTGNFETHLRVHTGEQPFCCKLCGHYFRTIGNLRSHTRSVHKIHEQEER